MHAEISPISHNIFLLDNDWSQLGEFGILNCYYDCSTSAQKERKLIEWILAYETAVEKNKRSSNTRKKQSIENPIPVNRV